MTYHSPRYAYFQVDDFSPHVIKHDMARLMALFMNNRFKSIITFTRDESAIMLEFYEDEREDIIKAVEQEFAKTWNATARCDAARSKKWQLVRAIG